MSVLHSPRAPWVMLAVFCAAALLLFAAAAGRDLGLIGAAGPVPESAPVKREVRMPIIINDPPKSGTEKEISIPTNGGNSAALAKQDPTPHLPKDPEAARPTRPTPPKPGPEAVGTLLAHSFRWRSDRFEARFETDRPVAGAKTFFKPSPAIWVVDLPGRWKNSAHRINTIDQGAIARVVIGEHPTFLRVVFHYRDKDRPRPEGQPLVAEEEKGLAVVIP